MALILLRHTRPASAEGLCYGRTDLDLDPGFPAAAAAIDAALPPVDRILTSPLSRCARLAAHVAARRSLAATPDPRLAEMDFGSWEARAWSELPRAELDAWAADFDHARPHGGESVAALASRVSEVLDEVGSGTTLWVTHSGVVRTVCALRGLYAGWQTPLDFGCWLEIP